MHENREAFGLSDRESGTDGPEKAESRTTGTKGTEESDGAIVPVNQLNKGGSSIKEPNAEVGEGRAQTKENISQTHTNSTQGGKKGVYQGLAGVRQAARERKEERFTALLHHLTPELLGSSFYALKRKAAAGVDGVRWEDYEIGLEGRIADLHSR
jgi:RNA-directed DNA polymerase